MFNTRTLLFCQTVLTVLLSLTSNVQAQCSPNQVQCIVDNSCLDNSFKCNYFDDCGDNTDEKYCNYPTVNKTMALTYIVNDRSALKSSMFILFGNPDDYIWKLGNSSLNTSLPINVNYQISYRDEFFRSVTVDYSTRQSFSGSNSNKKVVVGTAIDQLGLSNQYYYYFAQPKSSQIPSVTYDWLSQQFYWIDGQYNIIGVMSTTKSAWKAVISTNLTSPRDVVVNPLQNLLFWSDIGKIERSDMAGNNRRIIVSSSGVTITLPNKLVIDYSTNKLYWLDASSSLVGRCNFDGSQTESWTRSEFSTMSTMALYKGYMYFGDSRSPTIYIYSTATFSRIVSFAPPSSESYLTGAVVDMFMMASSNQPSATSPCQTANGNCQQFCFTTSSTTKQCDCGLGFTLSANGNCLAVPFDSTVSYLLVADFNQKNLYQLRPDTGELRVLLSGVRVGAVAFDPSRLIFYIAVRQQSPSYPNSFAYVIQRQSIDGRINEVIYTASSNYVRIEHLALDVSNQQLYYTDSYFGSISAMSTDGTNYRTVLSFVAAGTLPVAVAVDSTNGLLYWSTCETTHLPLIQVQNVVSTVVRTLYTGQTSTCISGLTIDVTSQVLYFVTLSLTADTTSTVNMLPLNGSSNTATVLSTVTSGNFRSLTLFNGSLYIADDMNRTTLKYDLRQNVMLEQPPRQFTNASDITSYTPVIITSTSTSTSTSTTTSTTTKASTPQMTTSTTQTSLYSTTGGTSIVFSPPTTPTTMASYVSSYTFSAESASTTTSTTMTSSSLAGVAITASAITDQVLPIGLIAGVAGGAGGLILLVIIAVVVILLVKYKIDSHKGSKPAVGTTVPMAPVQEVKEPKDVEVYDNIDDVVGGHFNSVYSEIDGAPAPPAPRNQNDYEALRRPNDTRVSRPIDTRQRPISQYPPNGNEYVDTINIEGFGTDVESKFSLDAQQVILQKNNQDVGEGDYLTVA